MDGRAANRVGFIQISNCAANCFCFPNLASMALSLRLYGRRACGRDDIVLASGNVASSGFVRSLVSMSVALSTQGEQVWYGILPVSIANLCGLAFGLV